MGKVEAGERHQPFAELLLVLRGERTRGLDRRGAGSLGSHGLLANRRQSGGKAVEQGVSAAAIVVAEPAERDLALTLDAFDQAVSDAYDKRAPHLLAEHAYRLAQAFSKFYAACPVLVAPDAASRGSRIALSQAALDQLELTLGLLGIDTPERM